MLSRAIGWVTEARLHCGTDSGVWENCAEKLGIDVARIQKLFDSPEAEHLFRENIKRAAELGVRASPTIFVDNHEFRANQLLRASGTPCQ